jgi:hypothetical protein
MKASDWKTTRAPGEGAEEWALPHPASTLAEPQITAEEARAATETICRWHEGLIASSPTSSDTEGKVFFCPIGRMYWRYTKQLSWFLRPLNYSKIEV